jgi:hypothetical protein
MFLTVLSARAQMFQPPDNRTGNISGESEDSAFAGEKKSCEEEMNPKGVETVARLFASICGVSGNRSEPCVRSEALPSLSCSDVEFRRDNEASGPVFFVRRP